MAYSSFTTSGNKAQTVVKLPKELFAVEINSHQLLKDVYIAYMANGRQNYAKTLKRGEVRGGGAKPWRQKGTGRARVGSSRTPVWRGGGITFGPSGNENYTRKVNTKAGLKALAQALTLSVNKNLAIIEDFSIKNGKTKSASALLSKIGSTRKTLIVVESIETNTAKALNNLQNTSIITAKNLNAYNILNSDSIVITKKALDDLSKRIGSKS